MKQEIINKATRLLSSTQYQVKKHSPEILMVAGIIDLIQIMSAKGPFNESKTSSKDVLDVEVKVIDDEEK